VGAAVSRAVAEAVAGLAVEAVGEASSVAVAEPVGDAAPDAVGGADEGDGVSLGWPQPARASATTSVIAAMVACRTGWWIKFEALPVVDRLTLIIAAEGSPPTTLV
jgi:hypothetical protein